MSEVTTLPVGELVVKANVRLNGGGVADDGLLESIAALGQLVPITVRYEDGVAVVTDGHRRLDALTRIGEPLAKVFVTGDKELTEAERIVQQVATSVHRKSLTDFELAQAAWDLKETGLKQGDIAAQLSISKKNVSDMHKVGKVLSKDDALDPAVANRFTFDSLTKIVESELDPRIQPSDVMNRIVNGDARDVWSAVRDLNGEAVEIAWFEEMDEQLKEWSAAGVQTTGKDPMFDGQTSSGSRKVVKGVAHVQPDKSVYVNDSDVLVGVTIAKHIKESCHMVWVLPANGYTRGRIGHYCIDKGKHLKTGGSQLKVKNAAELAKAATERGGDGEVMSATKAKQLRIDKAIVWLDGKHNTTSDIELAIEMAAATVHTEDYREFSRLLGYAKERETGSDFDWHEKRYAKYLNDTFENDQRKKNLLTVRLLKVTPYTTRPQVSSVFSTELDAIVLLKADAS